MKESHNLDFLRSIAVLLVLVDHLAMAAGVAERFPLVYDMGRLGVLLFFVHTSMVLMFSLERSEEPSGNYLFRGFYIRRAFRIYPLTIACVLLATIFGVPQTPGAHPAPRSLPQIVANLFLVQNLAGQRSVISPLWSLPLEVQMYLALPLLFIFARRRSIAALLGLGCTTALAGLMFDRAIHIHLARGLGRLDILDFAPCFVAGVMAYRLSNSKTPALSSRLWPGAVGAVVAVYLVWQMAFPSYTDRYPAYRGWVVCWILGLLIPHFRELRPRWLQTASHYVAKYSYGIYLGQVPALWIGFALLPHKNLVLSCILSVLILAAFAVAGYHCIEHPAIRLGKLVADRYKTRKSRLAELVVGIDASLGREAS
jgi:peptidoglycan/LPS O-acetylase OafA/YrhL